jgi:hypothetical protein
MLAPEEAKQIAERIAWPHTREELYAIRRALTEIIAGRERERVARLRTPEPLPKQPRSVTYGEIKLGPVSAAELVAMTARGE